MEGSLSGSRLTVSDRILLHLFEQPSEPSEYEVRPEASGRGLAKAVGILPKHIAQNVRPLIAQGFVIERVVRVRGGRKRSKAYFLTPSARRGAARLRGDLHSLPVVIEAPDGRRRTGTLGEARRLMRGVPLLTILRLAESQGYLRPDATAAADARLQFVEMLQDAPRVTSFVGRKAELESITADRDLPRLFVVRGMAGIGKSYLGAQACAILRGTRNLYWHRVRSWDTQTSILGGLGRFLDALGRPGLRSNLERGEPSAALQVLRSDVVGTRSFLVFDDGHEADAGILALFRLLKDAIADASDVRVLVLTRRSLDFYDRRDVVLDGLLAEIDLGGLGSEEVRSLVAGDADHLAVLGRKLGGHPLAVALARASTRRAGRPVPLSDIRRFMEEVVYRNLTSAERRVMKVASLYSIPVSREALLPDAQGADEILGSLVERCLLRVVGPDRLEAHEVIRDSLAGFLTIAERRDFAGFATRQLREIADRADAAGDVGTAIRALANAVRISPEREERASLWERLGEAHDRIGDLPEALGAFREARRLLHDPEASARLHRKAANLLLVRGERRAASKEIDEGLRVLGETASAERGWFHLLRGRVIGYRQPARSRSETEAAFDIFRKFGVRSGEAQAQNDLGFTIIHSPEGDLSIGERLFREALEFAERTHDVPLAADVHVNLAHFYSLHAPDSERALGHLRAVETLPGALDIPTIRSTHVWFRGLIDLELLADPRSAEAAFRELEFVGRRSFDRESLVLARYGLACCLHFDGHIQEARDAFEGVWLQIRSERIAVWMTYRTVWMMGECSILLDDVDRFREIGRLLEEPELRDPMDAREIVPHVFRGIDTLMMGDEAGCHSAFGEALRRGEEALRVNESPFQYLSYLAPLAYGTCLAAMGHEAEGVGYVDRAKEILATYRMRARLSTVPTLTQHLSGILGSREHGASRRAATLQIRTRPGVSRRPSPPRSASGDPRTSRLPDERSPTP